MNDETKQLIEDAAKLLGAWIVAWGGSTPVAARTDGEITCMFGFNPRDPERGDLMKVAMAAKLDVDFIALVVCAIPTYPAGHKVRENFDKDDHQSLALAVLRAASAVLKARGE